MIVYYEYYGIPPCICNQSAGRPLIEFLFPFLLKEAVSIDF